MDDIIKTEIELHKQFKNLDVIGFDMDMTAVRYNNENIGSLVYDCISIHLKKVFPEAFKNSVIDFNFCKRGLVIDLETGLILKLDNNKKVLKAFRGNHLVSREEIDELYHNHSIKEDSPMHSYSGNNCHRFFTMASFFETTLTCIFKDFMIYLEKEANATGKPIDLSQLKKLAKEIAVSFKTHFDNFYDSHYYYEFCANPGKFIYKVNPKFLEWLKLIRSKGTKVLLITNSKSEYTDAVMKYSYGENFKDHFDCIIVDAHKPEFFSKDKPFVEQHTYFPKGPDDYIPCDSIKLNSNSIFKGGNVNIALNAIRESLQKSDSDEISFCYVGDNIMGDVVAPKKLKMMTVGIIDEIVDPDEIIILKREKKTNEDVSISKEGLIEKNLEKRDYEWGSFFHVHDNHKNISIDTFWGSILRNNADIITPSVDTLAEYYYQDKFDNYETLSPCAVVYPE
ncbi:hypothetical protein DICPUDRAFT_87496 [Dictyostelium purpureum]|uniref:5'-nucleotidase n=1 Tax=Dictyostelium purpureum TaxID=5786 RepID=F0ZII1_DICPU|nr:uncharacterized protein DICPUDRAFT_87496 [Dictyostelium purpureum]EGC36267.1 hypothetical protein DICPUDRAFT_87496 [Dictyostelium purpureum]|eukprot:XP_003287213.1 hypothetical protein DICPUDRAFT_87496 [Dictyostelium purpureum]